MTSRPGLSVGRRSPRRTLRGVRANRRHHITAVTSAISAGTSGLSVRFCLSLIRHGASLAFLSLTRGSTTTHTSRSLAWGADDSRMAMNIVAHDERNVRHDRGIGQPALYRDTEHRLGNHGTSEQASGRIPAIMVTKAVSWYCGMRACVDNGMFSVKPLARAVRT